LSVGIGIIGRGTAHRKKHWSCPKQTLDSHKKNLSSPNSAYESGHSIGTCAQSNRPAHGDSFLKVKFLAKKTPAPRPFCDAREYEIGSFTGDTSDYLSVPRWMDSPAFCISSPKPCAVRQPLKVVTAAASTNASEMTLISFFIFPFFQTRGPAPLPHRYNPQFYSRPSRARMITITRSRPTIPPGA